MADFVSDLIARIQGQLPEMDEEKALRIESDLRNLWGGDRPYIGKTKFDREHMRKRDMRIFHDYQRNERPALLSRRFRLSIRRISQIISEQKKIEKNRA